MVKMDSLTNLESVIDSDVPTDVSDDIEVEETKELDSAGEVGTDEVDSNAPLEDTL